MTSKHIDNNDPAPTAGSGHEGDGNTISPLPGEAGIPDVAARRRPDVSKKGLFALLLLVASLVMAAAVSVQRFSGAAKKPEQAAATLVRDKPTAATSEPRRLDMVQASPASAAIPATPRIPALAPIPEDGLEARADPIGVRATGQATPTTGGHKAPPPEDAPVLLVSTRPGALGSPARPSATPGMASGVAEPDETIDPVAATSRNLQGYQRQLQGLLDSLTRSAALATAQAPAHLPSEALLGGPQTGGTAPRSGPTSAGGLFGGQLQGSPSPQGVASTLLNRSLTLPKGTAFTCALKTRVVSATSGLVGCQVQRNVFSDDGRVLLIERGSHLDGEYRITSLRPGSVRIPVLWTRIRTPLGVTVDIDSPGTGQLGESGIDGHVENRWNERIGAAMLLSLIDDAVKLVIQNQSSSANADRQADTIVLPSTAANTSKLAEKVLDSTINIPPLIYQNQGGIVGIYVARDVDFSSVYELQPTTSAPPREGRP